MNNIMLDLETMGTGANSAIIAIGAVRFDKDGIKAKFCATINLQSSIDFGLEIDANTVIWWMDQSDEARKAFKSGNNLSTVLLGFSEWIGDNARVWGNGAAFDNVLLSNAYKKTSLPMPWKFWDDMCYRTIKNLHKDVKFERVGTYHNAVDDAESQALHLIEIAKKYDLKL